MLVTGSNMSGKSTFLRTIGVNLALAFALLPDVPFVPTPEGQHLIKDLVIFFAAVAIGGTVYRESTSERCH